MADDALFERWRAVVTGPARAVRLDEALLIVAAHGRPGRVDVDGELQRLDDLAGRVAPPTLDGLTDLLFRELGFRGNQDDYHDPANSYLDQVLDRRCGLPITLSALMMELGRRSGVPVRGVGLPGHFIVGDQVDRELFIDPFHGGARLGRPQVEDIVRRFQPDVAFDDRWLESVPPLAVLARVLLNLRGVFQQRNDRTGLTWVLRLRVELPDGVDPGERRQLARLLAAAGDDLGAAGQLEALADGLERSGRADAVDAAGRLRLDARRLRARLN